MTDTSTTTAPDTAATAQLAPSVAKVLAALHRLGEATAAGTATEAGLGYSTTTPKLRTLENQGLAEPVRTDDGRTLWRLTDAGRAYAQREQIGDLGPTGAHPAEAQPTGIEASDAASPAAKGRRRDDSADGTTEHRDDAPAHADVPDEGGAGFSRPAAPSDPTGAEDDAGTATKDSAVADADGLRESMAGAEPAGESGTAPASAPDPAADPPQTGGATKDAGRDGAKTAAATPADSSPAAEHGAQAGSRRVSGTLRGAILDILEANPGRLYKVSELCKLIDQANEDGGAKKASPGAVHNAATKLVETGRAVLAVEKPVTFVLGGTHADSSPSTS